MEKLNQAICFAVQCHRLQKRKLSGAPYILHPLEALVIASGLTDDEDTLCAVVLHDVVEDTEATLEQIETTFGPEVAHLVAQETEKRFGNLTAEGSWKLRKEDSLNTLRQADDKRLKVMWLADKLSNLRAIARDYRVRGDEIWQCFHQHDKAEHCWYYRSAAGLVANEFGGTDAYREYSRLLDEVFG